MEDEAAVKPEPVWLVEDLTLLKGMKSEPEQEPIYFPSTERIQDISCCKPAAEENTYNNHGVESSSDEDNGEVKSELDIEEHNVLEYVLSYETSVNSGLQPAGKRMDTDKPDHNTSKGVDMHNREISFNFGLCNKSNTPRASHMNLHVEEKPFECALCSKCFRERCTLVTHMMIHTGDKPFKCNVCSKCFTQRATRAIHMRTHTGYKPFKCVECNKHFTQRSNLANHRRVHTGDKPFKCEVCSKSFNQSQNLRRHRSVHCSDK